MAQSFAPPGQARWGRGGIRSGARAAIIAQRTPPPFVPSGHLHHSIFPGFSPVRVPSRRRLGMRSRGAPLSQTRSLAALSASPRCPPCARSVVGTDLDPMSFQPLEKEGIKFSKTWKPSVRSGRFTWTIQGSVPASAGAVSAGSVPVLVLVLPAGAVLDGSFQLTVPGPRRGSEGHLLHLYRLSFFHGVGK